MNSFELSEPVTLKVSDNIFQSEPGPDPSSNKFAPDFKTFLSFSIKDEPFTPSASLIYSSTDSFVW